MFNAYILPILLYNCGTWSLTKTSNEKLDAFHRRLVRRIIGVFWPEKIPNEELYCKTGQIKLSSTMRNRRLTLLENTLRLSPDSPAQKSMDAYFQVPNKTTRGRSKTTIVSVLPNDLKSLYINLNNLEDLHKIKTMEKTYWQFTIFLTIIFSKNESLDKKKNSQQVKPCHNSLANVQYLLLKFSIYIFFI